MNQHRKIIIGIVPVIFLMLVPLAFASSQSTFDKNFKKCLNMANPVYERVALPLNLWKVEYKDFLGNITLPGDPYHYKTDQFLIQIDDCIKAQP